MFILVTDITQNIFFCNAIRRLLFVWSCSKIMRNLLITQRGIYMCFIINETLLFIQIICVICVFRNQKYFLKQALI
jgi:hypothetical protein